MSGTTSVVGAGGDKSARAADIYNQQAILKTCAPFTHCITEMNNTQVDHAKDLDVVKPMHNLLEYSGNYLKTSGSLYQFCRDERNDNKTDSKSFKSKSKFLDNTKNNNCFGGDS